MRTDHDNERLLEAFENRYEHEGMSEFEINYDEMEDEDIERIN